MNNLAVANYIGMHALQIQNVKRNVVKKVSINELNVTNKDVNIVSKVEIQHKEPSNNNNGTDINDLPQNEPVIEPVIQPVVEQVIEPFYDNSNLQNSALE
jgi:hypothetical protein